MVYASLSTFVTEEGSDVCHGDEAEKCSAEVRVKPEAMPNCTLDRLRPVR